MNVPPARTYLTVKEVADRFNVSTASIYRWIRERDFPRPLKIGAGTVRWRLSDIEEYESGLMVAYCMFGPETGFTFFLPAEAA